MTLCYNPHDWYWRADSGRVYSSASKSVVSTSDPAFAAWSAAGGIPTVWPRDELDDQTDAALRDVLAAAGVIVDLAAYAAAARYRAETAGVATPLGPVATDGRSKDMVLGALMAAQADHTWSTTWQFADGASATVDSAGITAIAAAVQAHVNRAFATYASVVQAISAGSGSIATSSDIDAAFASGA